MDPIIATNAVPYGQEQVVRPAEEGENSAAAITSDFETFLVMLTTQIQNQDPLKPMDSQEFAVQLATFSGVEQQVQSNDLLKQLTSQNTTAGLADMASWVGMEARSAAPFSFTGEAMTIDPPLVPSSDRTELVVRSLDGAEVQRFEIPNNGSPLQWAGVRSDGSLVPPGTYSLSVEGFLEQESTQTLPIETYDIVSEVQLDPTGPVLIMASGTRVSAEDVTALRQPDG